MKLINRWVHAEYTRWCQQDLNHRFREGYPPGGFPYQPRRRTRFALKVLVWLGVVEMIGDVPVYQKGKL